MNNTLCFIFWKNFDIILQFSEVFSLESFLYTNIELLENLELFSYQSDRSIVYFFCSHTNTRYTDEPISKILCNISDGEVIYLDRWNLDLQKNPDAEPTEEGKDTLPLSVLNNYFSFGVDAHIALEFHEARGG